VISHVPDTHATTLGPEDTSTTGQVADAVAAFNAEQQLAAARGAGGKASAHNGRAASATLSRRGGRGGSYLAASRASAAASTSAFPSNLRVIGASVGGRGGRVAAPSAGSLHRAGSAASLLARSPALATFSLADALASAPALPISCVVLASDGVWDVLSTPSAVAVAAHALAVHRDAAAAAQELCRMAQRYGSTDDITVVVVWLQLDGDGVAGVGSASAARHLDLGAGAIGAVPASMPVANAGAAAVAGAAALAAAGGAGGSASTGSLA
jgi:hypothetical protein